MSIAIHGDDARNYPATGLRSIWPILRQTLTDFSDDKCLRLAAAVSYYTVLSLAPLLLVLVAALGLLWDRSTVTQAFVAEIGGLAGPAGTEVVGGILTQASEPKNGVLAAAIGIGMLLIGATAVFLSLQDALNTIWEVKVRPGRGLWGFVRNRLLSVAMIVAIGFLLLVSLAVSTALAALQGWLLPREESAAMVWQVIHVAISVGVTSLLFAAIFKLLPDVRIQWRDVALGALLTGVLFTVGKFVLGLYLGHAAPGRAYGAAGSLVVLIIWIYYSAVILFFGAELTQVYSSARGAGITPASHAMWSEEGPRETTRASKRDRPAVGARNVEPLRDARTRAM